MAEDEFASTGEALGVLRSAMGYLAGADYTDMPGEMQAEVLRVMEHVDAVQAAVRGRAVSAFAAALTYHEYAVRGMPRWFVTQTKVTKAAGTAHKAWARRRPRTRARRRSAGPRRAPPGAPTATGSGPGPSARGIL